MKHYTRRMVVIEAVLYLILCFVDYFIHRITLPSTISRYWKLYPGLLGESQLS